MNYGKNDVRRRRGREKDGSFSGSGRELGGIRQYNFSLNDRAAREVRSLGRKQNEALPPTSSSNYKRSLHSFMDSDLHRWAD
ncbi:hypothetical protein CDAR_90191 [Caerostris darwini]|uniref:Uncharacterized protein n=1 Tax=Caerostris darwini TaxID=1538125 RepID=A0AAV4NU79_9ARAC|nr:hypothetical protein CDAR_90191 [Caerostris darwini]